MRKRRADSVADLLCCELRLDAFTGALRVGALAFGRQSNELERKLLRGDNASARAGEDPDAPQKSPAYLYGYFIWILYGYFICLVLEGSQQRGRFRVLPMIKVTLIESWRAQTL